MKKLLFAVLVMVASNVNAQSDKYKAAMGGALAQLGEAKDGDGMAAVASKFERIGDAEKTQWLPYYYAGMVKARMAMMKVGGEPDAVADEASTLIAKAEALEKNNSEIFCIKSMIATAKMLVDPQARFMTFGMESNQWIEAAKKADATNPRPLMLQANGLKGTPEQFGGGCKTAKPIAEKSVELYAAFKAASELHPTWGKESVAQIVIDCSK